MSADERRELVIRAAITEFALRGLEGTSTEAIAKRAGISQPYLFRLFPTKLALFIVASERGMQRISDEFTKAAEGLTGAEALEAMGQAYMPLLEDRELLMLQLHTYAACHEPDVRDASRRCWRKIYDLVQRLSGADYAEVTLFMAKGMLCNTMAAMQFESVDPEWVERILHQSLAPAPVTQH